MKLLNCEVKSEDLYSVAKQLHSHLPSKYDLKGLKLKPKISPKFSNILVTGLKQLINVVKCWTEYKRRKEV